MSSTPFLPFTRPSIDEETIAEVAAVLRSGWLTSGPKVQAFEAALSEYCGGRTVRAFNSGTATLEIALRLAGIGPGDEVITTPLTWVATANVILEVGATPVLVDIDPVTRNIDLNLIEAAITPKTQAIIPVDLAGLPVDRNRLYAITGRNKLRVIEDAAQSFGASWQDKPIGSSFGNGSDFVSFSFHANKNLTTSEGGALVLPADIDTALCERLRLQGVKRFPDGGMDVDVLGGKFNLTDIAATIGLGQLKHLREFTARRRHLAQRYFQRLDASLGLELPPADFENSNWHMFQPLLPAGTDRSWFLAAMKDAGIGVGVHYPALHLFSLYRALGFKAGDYPHAEDVGARTVTLPLFPAMLDADVDRVCRCHGQYLAENQSMTTPEISVIVPVYNEEAGLPALFDRIYPALDALNGSYEIIYVNDGSRDRSAALLREQFGRRPDVTRAILLASNAGQHMAIMAGFEHSRGRIVVTLDADLQNPPEEIGKLVEKVREGYDCVGSIRQQRQDSAFRRYASKAMNGLREKITRIKMTDQGCMLRAYSRDIVDAINSCKEVSTFIPALAYSFARNPTEVEVAHEERHAGESKYSLYALIRLNFDLMTSFSLAPLQIFSLLGIGVSAFSVMFVLFLFIRRLIHGPEAEGVFTLFGIAFFLIGLTLFGVGLLGEYIGRIYQQVRHRPRYRIGAILESGEETGARSEE